MAEINVTFVEQGDPVTIAFPLTATFTSGSASRDPEFDSVTLTAPGGKKWKITLVGDLGAAPETKVERIV